MSDFDLAAIKERRDRYESLADELDGNGCLPNMSSETTARTIGIAASFTAGDVPDLIAEVERLRAAANRIRLAADGRREYAVNAPDDQANVLRLEASVLDSAARIAEGDMDALRAWLPSWRWTDEMNKALESGE